MKKFFLPLIAFSIFIPNPVNSEIDPKILKVCMKANDFQGCVKAMGGGVNTASESKVCKGLNQGLSIVRERLISGTSMMKLDVNTNPLSDALAIATMKHRKFNKKDFKQIHPAGSLGAQLKTVEDIMLKDKAIPFVNENLKMRDALKILSSKKLGFLLIRDKKQLTKGIITDGELRRFSQKNQNLHSISVREIMTKNPIGIDKNELAVKALALMNDLIGKQVKLEGMPYYGLAKAKVGGRPCIISQTGFPVKRDMKYIFITQLDMLMICGTQF